MRYARNPQVLWRSTSRGPVVLAPHHEQPDRLGGMAAVVWELLDEPLDQAALAAQAADLVGSATGIDEALAHLTDAGLVTTEP